MISKPSKSGSRPVYAMRGFPAARQAPGPAPQALSLLHEQGNIEVRETERPATVPAAPPPDTVIGSPPAELPAKASTEPQPPPAAAPVDTPASTPKRPRKPGSSRTSQAYDLPPRKSRKRPRSNHFRLPEEIDEHLKELATMFECTRTHVVCSAIQAEWQRLRRRRARAAKQAEVTPAKVGQ